MEGGKSEERLEIETVKEEEKKDDNLCSTVAALGICGLFSLLFVGLVGYSIAKVALGSMNLFHCAIEPLIAAYMIVSGLSPLLFGGYGYDDDDDEKKSKLSLASITFAVLFHVAWVICGSVWTYPNFGKLNDVDFVKCDDYTTTGCLKDICDKSFITFAVATVTIDWIFTALGVVAFVFKLKSFFSRSS
ncbi:uncharacterized protein LOC132731337 [Ruditapes philippinarum]|uniref:uncharacterized protein LOC132731337 n=1 Tax=Ruditapes philippinarum TaxID=129788 RepID=UPI00295A7A8F|nr:uncharacterized protein LOC132731337 [Ruditapes philippinarum]